MSRVWILNSMVVVALIGLADSGYLGWTALTGGVPTCNILHGCAAVAASPYSQVLGIPLGVYGVLYYTIVLGFVLWRSLVPSSPRFYLKGLTSIGFILSLGFVYIQGFVIKAFCEYCLLSALTATILFALTLIVWRYDTLKG